MEYINSQERSIPPHGGILINRIVPYGERLESLLEKYSSSSYVIQADDHTLSDMEMIAIGAFSPLTGFMTKERVLSVLESVEIENGVVWAIPVILPVEKHIARRINRKDSLERRTLFVEDKYGILRGMIQVEDIFTLPVRDYLHAIYQTEDQRHPGVRKTLSRLEGKVLVSGEVSLLSFPSRSVNPRYYLSPRETREYFKKKGWETIVAFQTRNPIHRAHEHIIKSALEFSDGLLIHPLVGPTKKDDIPADVRMSAYEALISSYFNRDAVLLAALPAAMHYAGPREALHHLIIRQNYGATAMIIGRDHAGVGSFYPPYAAQAFVKQYEQRLHIKPLFFKEVGYCSSCGNIVSEKTCPHGKMRWERLSGTEVRRRLREGEEIPPTFSRPEVVKILREYFERKNEEGEE